MKDLPEKTLCPYETVCVVDSTAFDWRIVSLSVTLAFAVVNDVHKFISNVTFLLYQTPEQEETHLCHLL